MSESSNSQFSGRIAVVTGGSRGIGKAIGQVLAQKGATVILGARNLDQAEETAKALSEQTGQEVLAYPIDVSNFDEAQTMAKEITSRFGKVDILVNNAGITRDDLIMRMPEEDWDIVININLKSVYNCSKAFIRGMMRKRYGRIVNITSVSGQAGQVGQTNYSASKAGMIGFTKALAREVATRNVTVNAVAPGFIPTALTDDLPEELVNQILTATPMGRMGTPEEVAYAVAFLASEEASYITGQILGVDGGMAMM